MDRVETGLTCPPHQTVHAVLPHTASGAIHTSSLSDLGTGKSYIILRKKPHTFAERLGYRAGFFVGVKSKSTRSAALEFCGAGVDFDLSPISQNSATGNSKPEEILAGFITYRTCHRATAGSV